MASSSLSLPFDLVEEILCRVPIESLTRFQLTCKRWFALFKDKRLIYKHLAFVQQQQFIRFSFLVDTINHENESIKPMPPTLIVQGRVETSVTAHCDGLLLCGFDLGKLLIWNPYLKQVKWIRPMNPYSYDYYYAIGYDFSRDDDYKILRFYDGHDYEGKYHWPNDPEVEIYNFKSSLWKTLEFSWDWYVFKPYKGVSLNGNTYWIAEKNHDSNLFIQCFDFSVEKFEPVCSLPLTFGVSDFIALSDFRGDQLSLLHQRKETMEVDIWITSKIKNGGVVSWTKLFNVMRPNLPVLHASTYICDLDDPVYFIDRNNRIVVCCEELLEDERYVCASVYVIGEDRLENTIKVQNHRNRGGPHWPFICSYAHRPSLVPVPK